MNNFTFLCKKSFQTHGIYSFKIEYILPVKDESMVHMLRRGTRSAQPPMMNTRYHKGDTNPFLCVHIFRVQTLTLWLDLATPPSELQDASKASSMNNISHDSASGFCHVPSKLKERNSPSQCTCVKPTTYNLPGYQIAVTPTQIHNSYEQQCFYNPVWLTRMSSVTDHLLWVKVSKSGVARPTASCLSPGNYTSSSSFSVPVPRAVDRQKSKNFPAQKLSVTQQSQQPVIRVTNPWQNIRMIPEPKKALNVVTSDRHPLPPTIGVLHHH